MIEFKMPSLGADMEAGTLVEWKVKPGDRVHRGDIVAIVDTDKAAIEMEIWKDGIIDQILVQTGEKVPVGTVLARLQGAEEEKSKIEPPIPVLSLRASPLARKRAQELGVELTKIKGSGPGGVITEEDVKGKLPPQEGLRRATASAMVRSKREIPHYYLANTIDIAKCLNWLESENLKRGVPDRLIYSVLLLKAVAVACTRFPEMNGFYQNDKFESSSDVHIGMGISLKKRGLISPAILNANKKNLTELMVNLRDLAERARSGTLRSSEMSSATITITNLGELGVDQVFGVIYPPQVALVGFGKISPIRTLTVTLAADHRVSDGYRGGLFLTTIGQLLQEPEKL